MNSLGYIKPYLWNNFAATLSQPLAASDESLYLDEVSSEFYSSINRRGGLHNWRTNQEWRAGIPLTLQSGDDIEIVVLVELLDQAANQFKIMRGMEGTAPIDFPGGTAAEIRLTVGTLKALANQCELAYFGGVVIGEQAYSNQDWWGDVIIGQYAYAWRNAVDGDDQESVRTGANTIIGTYAESGAKWEAIVIGEYARARAEAEGSVCIGAYAQSQDEYAISLGYSARGSGITVGQYAGTRNTSDIAVGHSADARGKRSIAFGDRAYADAAGAISIGDGDVKIAGGLRITALPYAPKDTTPQSNAVEDGVPAIAFAASSPVTLVTSEINLAATDSTEMELPENTILLIDSLDFVVTESSNSGGNPEIKVGTDETEDDTLLEATEITATALHSRQTFAPAHSHGVTSVRVATATAGSGTLKGKLVVRGYVMEV